MKFLVAGAGGVGGFFGAKLAHAGERVWLLARGRHLEAMQQHGLIVKTAEGELHVPKEAIVGDPGQLPSAPDVVLFCVKSYDTRSTADQLRPALREGSAVLSLQNGVENEDILATALPGTRIYGGAAYIYATITAPGIVTEGGGPRKIVFGPMDGRLDAAARSIHDTFQRAKVSADLTADTAAALWKKFVFISAVGGLTALTRLELGEILRTPETEDLLRRAMTEVEDVARAKGIRLETDLSRQFLDTLRKFNTRTRSSLYYDLERGKPLEIEALSGAVVRLGREAGVVTPVHEMIYASLLPHHLKHSTRST